MGFIHIIQQHFYNFYILLSNKESSNFLVTRILLLHIGHILDLLGCINIIFMHDVPIFMCAHGIISTLVGSSRHMEQASETLVSPDVFFDKYVIPLLIMLVFMFVNSGVSLSYVISIYEIVAMSAETASITNLV